MKSSRPRWQNAAVSWYFGSRAAVELDENVRDVVGQQASQLDSVRFHKERQRLRDASQMGTMCDKPSPESITKPDARHEAQRQNSHRHVHGGHVGRLEQSVRHVLPDGLGVHNSFREQDGVVLRHNPELVEEGIGGYIGHGLTILRKNV